VRAKQELTKFLGTRETIRGGEAPQIISKIFTTGS